MFPDQKMSKNMYFRTNPDFILLVVSEMSHDIPIMYHYVSLHIHDHPIITGFTSIILASAPFSMPKKDHDTWLVFQS